MPQIIPGPYDVVKIVSNDSYLFASVQSGGSDSQLYRSADGGQTWQNIHQDLPQGQWVTLAVNGNTLMAGTNPAGTDFNEAFLYRSLDNGTSWESFKPGMYVDSDITYLGYLQGYWWAGTEESGLWRYDSGAMGLPDQQLPLAMTVSPNPAATTLNVRLTADVAVEEMRLLDLRGRLLQSRKDLPPASQFSLDVCPLQNGTYILTLQTKDKKASAFFIKR